jgi:hypothetical protein
MFNLAGEQRRVLAGRKTNDLKPVGVRVNDRQRASADRSG